MIVFIPVLIFTAGPSDFQLLFDQIIIPSTMAVGTPVCLAITILGDTVEEEDETFTVAAFVTIPDTITQPNSITVTIVDDGDGMFETTDTTVYICKDFQFFVQKKNAIMQLVAVDETS